MFGKWFSRKSENFYLPGEEIKIDKENSTGKKQLRPTSRHKLASKSNAAEITEKGTAHSIHNTVTADPLMSNNHSQAPKSNEKPSENDAVNGINSIGNIVTCR